MRDFLQVSKCTNYYSGFILKKVYFLKDLRIVNIRIITVIYFVNYKM